MKVSVIKNYITKRGYKYKDDPESGKILISSPEEKLSTAYSWHHAKMIVKNNEKRRIKK